MTQPLDLSQVFIQLPCDVPWTSMTGSSQVRFCDQCELNVYNLSALSQVEAEALITAREGKLCATYFQRPDGTIVTKDCTALKPAVKFSKKIVRPAVGAASILTIVTLCGLLIAHCRAHWPCNTKNGWHGWCFKASKAKPYLPC